MYPPVGETRVLEAMNRTLHPVGVSIRRYTTAAYAFFEASLKPMRLQRIALLTPQNKHRGIPCYHVRPRLLRNSLLIIHDVQIKQTFLSSLCIHVPIGSLRAMCIT